MKNYENIDKALLGIITQRGPVSAGALEAHIRHANTWRKASLDIERMVTAKSPHFRIVDRRLQALRKAESIRHLSKADGGPGWVLA